MLSRQDAALELAKLDLMRATQALAATEGRFVAQPSDGAWLALCAAMAHEADSIARVEIATRVARR